MEPLKRFTQCGSLTMLFAVFIVLFGVSSTALTTFGKSPPNPPPAPTQPPGKCSPHSMQLKFQNMDHRAESRDFLLAVTYNNYVAANANSPSHKLNTCVLLCASVKARECVAHNDCSSIQHTSCVRDGSEYRCLCGNNKPPVNGYCTDTPKRK